ARPAADVRVGHPPLPGLGPGVDGGQGGVRPHAEAVRLDRAAGGGPADAARRLPARPVAAAGPRPAGLTRRQPAWAGGDRTHEWPQRNRWSHRAAAVRALSALAPRLLAEDPDGQVAALAVDVDGQVAEVVDQLVHVLGLDLAEVEARVLAERGVHLVLGLGRDQAREPDAGPQQLQRRPDVDLDRALFVVRDVGDD